MSPRSQAPKVDGRKKQQTWLCLVDISRLEEVDVKTSQKRAAQSRSFEKSAHVPIKHISRLQDRGS
jgi:hypothetical protein